MHKLPKGFEIMAAAGGKNEIRVYGPIGGGMWDDSGVTDKDILDALSAIPEGQKITLRVNSEGGSVWDGLAIYNALKRRSADITAVVDGVALSIASFIPLAAGKVVSPRESIWMIHDPWTMTVGNADDHIKAAEMLETHAGTIVGAYAARTGKSEDEIRAAMKAETWMRGDEAVEFGLADSVTDQPADLAAASVATIHNAPQWVQDHFSNRRVAVAASGNNKNNRAETGAGRTEDQVERKNILALLQKHGAKINDNDSDEALMLQLDGILAAQKAELDAQKASAEAQRKARITDKYNSLAAERPNCAISLDQCIENEKLLEAVAKWPTISDPVGRGRVQVGKEGICDHMPTDPKARLKFMVNNFSKLQAEDDAGNFRSPHDRIVNGQVFAANTDSTSGALVPAIVADSVITNLTNRLAPLRAFSRLFSTDRIKSNSVVQVPRVTAGGTAQTDATSFEDTTNFVGTINNCAVTPAQYTAGGHITMDEFRNGYRLSWWAEQKIAELSDALMAAVAANITTGNFSTHTALTSATASFGASEMKSLWGTLKKAPMKYLVIDGEALANLLPSTREDWDGVSGSYPGWEGIYLNTVWTGATTNTYGFACAPQAIACAAGLPIISPNASRAGLGETVITLPEIGLSVAMYEWFATAGRVDWMTLDVMFGANDCDTTAGVLIKSA